MIPHYITRSPKIPRCSTSPRASNCYSSCPTSSPLGLRPRLLKVRAACVLEAPFLIAHALDMVARKEAMMNAVRQEIAIQNVQELMNVRTIRAIEVFV